MIEVSQLSKSFGQTQALDNVSFKVKKGQIVGFLGANGAGKTTTMDIICGCIGADTGFAKVAGFDITEEPLLAKAKLGYLPDEPPLHMEMRVSDFITYTAKLNQVPANQIATRVAETIARLSLESVKDRVIGNLSKGYKQRVAFAQAIVHDPEVLILDEPTEGLDPNQIAQIRDLIKSLAGEHTILLSSHILSEVQNTCDHIIIIHNGKVVRQGSYEELVSHMQSGKSYKLKVRENAEGVVGAIAGIKGVSSPQKINDDGEIEFSMNGAEVDALDLVAKAVLDGGFGLRELTPKTHSLEEVFFEITH